MTAVASISPGAGVGAALPQPATRAAKMHRSAVRKQGVCLSLSTGALYWHRVISARRGITRAHPIGVTDRTVDIDEHADGVRGAGWYKHTGADWVCARMLVKLNDQGATPISSTA